MRNLAEMSPSDVVAEALRRLETEDYAGAAELYHPTVSARAVANSWSEVRHERKVPTVEGLLKTYPDMPRQAAEWEVRQAGNRPPPSPSFERLYGVESEAALQALEPREVLSRRLWASDLRWRFRAYLDGLMQEHPEYRDQLAQQRAALEYPWSGEPLGCVERGDRAFVVLGGREEERPENMPDDHLGSLVVLRRTADGWRISSELGMSDGVMAFLHVAVKNADGERIVLS